jgi:PAS domain S-box-containing protein
VLRALERRRLRDERRLAEQRLLASEQRFRALIEHSSDGIVLLGRDAGFLYASPSTMRILGYAVEELIGRCAFELVHRDDVAAVRDAFEKVL